MFSFGKTGQIVKLEAQADLGVEFVDVLASRPAGSRKIGPRRGVDGIVEEKGVHALLYIIVPLICKSPSRIRPKIP
jgi:hypothetical protein